MVPDISKSSCIKIADLRDGESIADAAHRLRRHPLDLFADLLDAELKPKFGRKPKRVPKPRDKTLAQRAAKLADALGKTPNGVRFDADGQPTFLFSEKAEAAPDPLPRANGHDDQEANPWHSA